MFAAVFVFALIIVHVAAEIPSYIHVCGRRDPNLDQCILNNIKNLKDKICEGMPELNIKSNNPFLLDKLVIFDTPSAKLYFEDSKVMGLCDFIVNSFHMNINKLHFDADLLYKQIQINGTYDINLRLLVPVANKAQIYIIADNVGVKVSTDMEMVTKSGQKYVFVSKMKINLDIKGYNIKFSNETELSQFREIVRNFLGNNQKEIIKNFKPVLEEAITKRVISVSRDLVKHFTYEELFPDRT